MDPMGFRKAWPNNKEIAELPTKYYWLKQWAKLYSLRMKGSNQLKIRLVDPRSGPDKIKWQYPNNALRIN